uniref:Exonuclease domain-containing protein n=1 Tax=viral metagenome TaxID=1070528 RepID=A0A6C0B0K8_9ZZZZ
MKLLIFDTETTGLPKSREPAIKASNNWPHLVSIAWTVIDTSDNFKTISSESHIVKPEWNIPADSTAIHGITQAKAEAEGVPLSTVIQKFFAVEHDMMLAHNMNFDYNVLVNAIMWDLKLGTIPDFKPKFCSMEAMKNVMQIPYANGRGFKPPKLTELYTYVVKKPFDSGLTHSAQYDTELLVDIIKNSNELQIMMGLITRPDNNPNASKKARTLII